MVDILVRIFNDFTIGKPRIWRTSIQKNHFFGGTERFEEFSRDKKGIRL